MGCRDYPSIFTNRECEDCGRTHTYAVAADGTEIRLADPCD